MPKEAVLIVNAHSRRGQALFEEAKAKLEAAGIKLVESHPVDDPGDLNETVRNAVRGGAPMVIVGGGDGSLSCTVDFVVDKDCVFALLPLGTANSFARTLGIPLDLDGAIATIASGRRKRVDLGVIDHDYFVNGAAIGLAPMVANSVPHKLKKVLGRFGYLAWGVWCLIHFRPFELTVDDGTTSRKLKALEVRIANGPYHGGVEVVEQADVDTGEIIVQAVTGHYRTRLIWNWLATLLRLPARKDTTEDFHGRKMRVITKPPLPISIDGEVLGHTPAEVAVAPGVIEVVVPAEDVRDSESRSSRA